MPCDVRSTPESGHVRCKRDVRLVPIADSPKGQYRCQQWSCTIANAVPEKSWTKDLLIVLIGIVLPIILLLFLAWHYLL